MESQRTQLQYIRIGSSRKGMLLYKSRWPSDLWSDSSASLLLIVVVTTSSLVLHSVTWELRILLFAAIIESDDKYKLCINVTCSEKRDHLG